MELVTIYLSYIFLRWTVSHYLFDVRSHMKSRNYAVCHQDVFPNIIHMSCFENKDLKKVPEFIMQLVSQTPEE